MTLLVIEAVQVTLAPPPLPEPLHCVTEVMSWLEVVVFLVQVGAALAAPKQATTVSEELVTPVARSRLFVTVTVHSTARPPPLSVPLH